MCIAFLPLCIEWLVEYTYNMYIYLFNKNLLSSHYLPGIKLDPQDIKMVEVMTPASG